MTVCTQVVKNKMLSLECVSTRNR